MIEFLVDQNFNEDIVDGLTRRDATLRICVPTTSGTGSETTRFAVLTGDDGVKSWLWGDELKPDEAILEWAAARGLVLLTHDRKTIPPLAHARVVAGLPMPGVFLVHTAMPIGQAIDELLIAAHCLSPDECKDLVRYFPL